MISGSVVGPAPAVAATPVTITAVADAGVSEVGVSYFFATATLAGGEDPTGTVTFRLFGPGDPICARPPTFTSTNPVTGAGDAKRATSDRFVPNLGEPGVYHFVAAYSGDARNAPAGPTPCDNPTATLGFGSSSVSLSGQASGPVAVGGTVWDTATIAESSDPNGTMTFALYGPDVPGCTGTPAFTSVRPVRGDGRYTSEPFVPAQPGTYRWVASFAGDANDAHLTTSCDDPSQQVTVSPAQCGVPVATPLTQPRPAPIRQVLQGLGGLGLSALLGRAGGPIGALTVCLAATPPR